MPLPSARQGASEGLRGEHGVLLFEFLMYFLFSQEGCRARPAAARWRCRSGQGSTARGITALRAPGGSGDGGGPLRGAGLETPALAVLLGQKIEEKSLGFTLPSRGEGS